MNSLIDSLKAKCSSHRMRILMVFVLGLSISQMISTLLVYSSNIELFEKCQSLTRAGYLVVPNQHITMTMKNMGPAIWGGLFFTLSVGAGVTVFSFVLSWWGLFFLKKKNVFFIIFTCVYVAIGGLLFYKGARFLVIAYFLIIPPVIFFSTKRLLSSSGDSDIRFEVGVHLTPILILAVLWGSQMSRDLFLDLRDNFLLSNPFGYHINNFYYDYTLYPAGVFKTIEQKLIKTVNLEDVSDKRIKNALKNKFLKYDYLPVSIDAPVDLKIVQTDNKLNFINDNKIRLTISSGELLSHFKKNMSLISEQCDRYGAFRKITIISLLMAFPVVLYIFFFSFLHFFLHLFFNRKLSSVLVSICCLIAGLLMLFPIYKAAHTHVETDTIKDLLASGNRIARVAAIKKIIEKRMDLAEYVSPKKLFESEYLPEVYWSLRALSYSKHPDVSKYLLACLDSPHINIVCQAYYALGRLRDTRLRDEIIRRIYQSDNWYQQFYAYRALRRTGWKQNTLK